MGDEKFMKELMAVAREEEDKRNSLSGTLLNQLAEGTLSDEGLAQLQAMAKEDESLEVAMEAFKPLGDDFEESLTDTLMAMVTENQVEEAPVQARARPTEEKPSLWEWFQSLFQFENPVFGPAFAGAAALAMVAVFYPGGESPLGRYNLEVSQGDATMRGEAEQAVGVATYSTGSNVQILLRPNKGGDDAITVRVYLASDTEFTALNIPAQISPTGAVRLSGQAGQAFPARDNPYRVVTVLSRFADTPDEETIRQAGQAGSSTEGEHWQILTTQIKVQ